MRVPLWTVHVDARISDRMRKQKILRLAGELSA